MIWIAIAIASRAKRRKCRLRLTWFACLILGCVGILPPTPSQASTTNYFVTGVLKGVKQEEHQLIIAHEAIPNFMDAMTMPFNVRDAAILTNVVVGGKITFLLHVTETESWVDHIEQASGVQPAAGGAPTLLKGDSQPEAKTNSATNSHSKNPLRDFKFTNELGQPVSLSDFQGQAIALTFIFTRCPIPEYCPRLSRNFEQAQQRLEAMENGPTNWHLISVSFDPAHDTPEVLKAYGAAHHYDPRHWSFITGPQDKIAELARSCDVKFDPDNGLFNHNFRTLIIDASNHLQMVFPTSGDLSESIVQELLKAAGGTNQIADSATNHVRTASDR